jgi:sortase B
MPKSTKNKSNHLITIITKNNTYYYQIFSSYIINNENYYITTDFKDDKEYINFLNIINKRSIYNYNVKLNSQDKILTLSSCYNNNKKIVVHAKRLN